MRVTTGLSVAALLTVAGTALGANNLLPLKKAVTQDFEHKAKDSNECGAPTCANDIPGVSQYLYWDLVYPQPATVFSGFPTFQEANTGAYYGFLGLPDRQFPTLSVKYRNSTVSKFDLDSFALGCAAKHPNNSSDPNAGFTYGSADCTWTVAAYNKLGANEPADYVQQIDFKATPSHINGVNQPAFPMTVYSASKQFPRAKKVVFQALPLVNATYYDFSANIDTVKYVVHFLL